MYRISHYLILIYLICTNCANHNQALQKFDLDSMFLSWNQATYLSILQQAKQGGSLNERELYDNRKTSFLAFVGISKSNQLNKQSIRYKFLREYLEIKGISPDFYIIEANKSGEQVEIKTFVAETNGSGYSVSLFTYLSSTWTKQISKNIKSDLKILDLKSQAVEFGSGFNQGDIIISHVKDGKILSSEYFLLSTISESSIVRNLIW